MNKEEELQYRKRSLEWLEKIYLDESSEIKSRISAAAAIMENTTINEMAAVTQKLMDALTSSGFSYFQRNTEPATVPEVGPELPNEFKAEPQKLNEDDRDEH